MSGILSRHVTRSLLVRTLTVRSIQYHTGPEADRRARESPASLGSQARLPAPSPLRTVRASFPAYSSSLCQGIFRHPLSQLISGVLLNSMTTGMVQLNVARCNRPTVGSFHNEAGDPRGTYCDRFLTGRTQAILPQPDPVELRAAPWQVHHPLAPSGLEVWFPLWVVRIGPGLDLDMPL